MLDIGLREWLIIGGVFLILLIVIDGWRRMRSQQRDALRINIDHKLTDTGEETSNPELPNGGARVKMADSASPAPRQQPQPAPATAPEPLSRPDRQEPTLSQPGALLDSAPEAEYDPLFDDIPDILSTPRPAAASAPVKDSDTDPHEALEESLPHGFAADHIAPPELESTAEADHRQEQPAAPKWDLEQPITVLMKQFSTRMEDDDLHEPEPQTPMAKPQQPQSSLLLDPESEPASEPLETDTRQETVSAVPSAPEPEIIQPDINAEAEQVAQIETMPAAAQEIPVPADTPEAPRQDSLFDEALLEGVRTDRKVRQEMPEPGDIMVITVVSKADGLSGEALLQVVLACGMRFGDMELFHRFEDGADEGAVQFSMANAVQPGSFELESMAAMTTPGVSFFMSLHEPRDPKNAFECMLATAETVAKHLDGDLLDEHRSVMRPQTKAHYRERIREYEMHKRAPRARQS